MHCVDFFLSGSFEDMGIYLSVMGRYNLPLPFHELILPMVPLQLILDSVLPPNLLVSSDLKLNVC